MGSLDGLVHDVDAFPEFRPLVLVADTQVLEVEGSRMAHLRPLGSPLGVGPAVAELDEVKGVLDKDIVESVAVGLGFQEIGRAHV